MAVENKYVGTDVAAGKKAEPAVSCGGILKCAAVTFEVAAANDDGSVFRVLKGMNPDSTIVKIEVLNDAITAGTDYDLGLYLTDKGAVVDKDAFSSAVDMSSARAVPTDITNEALDIASIGKKLYEIAGHTLATRKESYDLAFTANTVGSAAGTITVRVFYV
jgi:hypothetical protein